ncbi:deoxyribose-phosphate aldolase [Maridesulfovibrio ferrireducens]|uniref:Deoxyribose-phosphate aldolase n=1 Tax=Maridesulfovibrio ferrireducens TaxID=246191 RepID=A0A1G9EFJ9_9BACT|nr:deoxyribose-phosphate aldolase [Maridesulfovibrio ferrireducens]SDK74884.1 deoxyribose-phosphate aldolase [Maridesulfovibrio ferrireducens]
MDVIKNLASYVDHTLLDISAGPVDIEQLCREAVEYGFASVCIHPWHVAQASELLRFEKPKVCSVIGFPSGATLTEVKMIEAMRTVEKGAQELDMVVNVGALKAGDINTFLKDIFMTVEGAGGVPVKAIIETGLLDDDQKKQACALAVKAGASFVKTCTGFNCGSATVEDIKLMRASVGKSVGVKASGGIKTYDHACELVAAGATRLGTSSSIKIIQEAIGG